MLYRLKVCHEVQLSNLEEINACMAVPRYFFFNKIELIILSC